MTPDYSRAGQTSAVAGSMTYSLGHTHHERRTSSAYAYAVLDVPAIGLLEDSGLMTCLERHKYALQVPELRQVTDISAAVLNADTAGVVFGLRRGDGSRQLLRLTGAILRQGRRVYFHWPEEDAIESIDRFRFRSYRNLWFFTRGARVLRRGKNRLRRFWGSPVSNNPSMTDVIMRELRDRMHKFLEQAAPVALPALTAQPTNAHRLPGHGVYLRSDFWAPINSGGSYGHTCYVAKELARTTEDFTCFMPMAYSLLDEMGVRQVVLPSPGSAGDEDTIACATRHYYVALKAVLAYLKPAYIYERACLGNFAAALLSHELGIPYLLEYNGSEISMKSSFESAGYRHESFYLSAETAAFRQATAISVVSRAVKDELVERGVPAEKVVVIPNGTDPDVYCPQSAAAKAALRRELGLEPNDRVIGFTGTFGGWHGIDVLAEALPRICKRVREVRFLLIGDGTYKHLVDEAVTKHQLSRQVRSLGRVPQQEGARMLGACDIFFSPHNKHIAGRPFFGSPTKVFEYMAMAGGIVASDLEQIGEILSPALRIRDLKSGTPAVTNQRAILCEPGNVDECVEAVVQLARQPELCQALGKNARQAILDHFSWEKHVARLWSYCRGAAPADWRRSEVPGSAVPSAPSSNGESLNRIATGDGYKEEVQNQWNSNPCGSQYVKNAAMHTLQWYQEAERYRYGDYAPWMPRMMEFSRHAGEQVLEIGGGMGTDLAQFARHGAHVTDLDLSAGHLALAQENFALRGLKGTFVHQDAECLPFADRQFDLVYSNGVIHHTPNTAEVISEIHRVLKPGGRAIIMVYCESSLHYWGRLVHELGILGGELDHCSVGEIMSRHVEISATGAKPLVKAYTKPQMRHMFGAFAQVRVYKRQLTRPELWNSLRWFPLGLAGRLMGWNLIVKATKSKAA